MEKWRFCWTFRLAQSKPIFTVAGRPLRHFCRRRTEQTSRDLRIVVRSLSDTLSNCSVTTRCLGVSFVPMEDDRVPEDHVLLFKRRVNLCLTKSTHSPSY